MSPPTRRQATNARGFARSRKRWRNDLGSTSSQGSAVRFASELDFAGVLDRITRIETDLELPERTAEAVRTQGDRAARARLAHLEKLKLRRAQKAARQRRGKGQRKRAGLRTRTSGRAGDDAALRRALEQIEADTAEPPPSA